MGLANHDDMRQRRSANDAPIRPPQRDSAASMLRIALFWVCVLAALWAAGNWLMEQKRAAVVVNPSPALAPSYPTPQQRPVPAYPGEDSSARTVNKCTINGKVTYTEGGCPSGATAKQLRVDAAPIGMLSPLASPSPMQQSPPSSVPVDTVPAQSIPQRAQPPAFDRAAECRFLDAEIQKLDAWARQPQSGQMQDWIRDQRKKARDRQFEIRCQ